MNGAKVAPNPTIPVRPIKSSLPSPSMSATMKSLMTTDSSFSSTNVRTVASPKPPVPSPNNENSRPSPSRSRNTKSTLPSLFRSAMSRLRKSTFRRSSSSKTTLGSENSPSPSPKATVICVNSLALSANSSKVIPVIKSRLPSLFRSACTNPKTLELKNVLMGSGIPTSTTVPTSKIPSTTGKPVLTVVKSSKRSFPSPALMPTSPSPALAVTIRGPVKPSITETPTGLSPVASVVTSKPLDAMAVVGGSVTNTGGRFCNSSTTSTAKRCSTNWPNGSVARIVNDCVPRSSVVGV